MSSKRVKVAALAETIPPLHDVFLAMAGEDEPVGRVLCELLGAYHLKPRAYFHEASGVYSAQIAETISRSRALVPLITPALLAKPSSDVVNEIAIARKRHLKIIPVFLSGACLDGLQGSSLVESLNYYLGPITAIRSKGVDRELAERLAKALGPSSAAASTGPAPRSSRYTGLISRPWLVLCLAACLFGGLYAAFFGDQVQKEAFSREAAGSVGQPEEWILPIPTVEYSARNLHVDYRGKSINELKTAEVDRLLLDGDTRARGWASENHLDEHAQYMLETRHAESLVTSSQGLGGIRLRYPLPVTAPEPR